MENLGERIKQLLDKRGITQKELAEKTGCTEAAISHYIKGDRTPRASVLSKIAITLGTTSEFLMDGVPVTVREEIGFAKKLIARNAAQMTMAEKKEILNILMGGEDE